MERKTAVSADKLLTIQVPFGPAIDYGNGLIEVPKESMIDIKIAFDFTEDKPPFGINDDWWHVDQETGIVHVQFHEASRKRYIELMDKKFAEDELSHEEASELETLEVMLNVLPQTAGSKAVLQNAELYKALQKESEVIEEAPKEEKKEYRTKAKAGEVAEVPSQMPLITNPTYQNAITYNEDDKAYLQPLTSADGLVFENGMLYFEGLPATSARLAHLYTKDNIEEFNLPMLRVFYAIILKKFQKTWNEDKSVDEVLTFYYPDLAKQLGKSSNISQEHINSTINTILSFQNIMGIIDKGKRGNDILPVLVFLGNDTEANTIKFASPYMLRVIQDVYKASIRKSKVGLPMLNKDGSPKLLPSHTYIPNLKLGKERNQKAVEIVCIIMTTIEQAGNHVPHISARTIVERNQLLKQSIDNTTRLSNKNTYLERAFSKAWQLLRTHTDILERYKNIQLPDPKDKDFKVKYIPTMSTLDMVFEFPHEGKIKE